MSSSAAQNDALQESKPPENNAPQESKEPENKAKWWAPEPHSYYFRERLTVPYGPCDCTLYALQQAAKKSTKRTKNHPNPLLSNFEYEWCTEQEMLGQLLEFARYPHLYPGLEESTKNPKLYLAQLEKLRFVKSCS